MPLRPRLGLRRHSTSAYASTLRNLKLSSDTRVIYQGFTGPAASSNALQSLDYGTAIVGGSIAPARAAFHPDVTPGQRGSHLSLPLFATVAEAARTLRPAATAVFVAAPHAAAAIEEAIAAEIPLIVAVAEHVPLHAQLRLHAVLRTQRASRLVGANCAGIISPHARCRIGLMPHASFLPGCVGVVAKSGTLSYEAVAATTRVGLGQSLVVGMGGDVVAGTSLGEAVEMFLEDGETEGVVVIGEVGGAAEMEVADKVQAYRSAGGRKPVMALVAGACALEGRVMGHAGAFRGVGDPSVRDKIKALEGAGVVMVEHPGMFGEGMLRLLGRPMPPEPVKGMGLGGPGQRRGLHIMAWRRPVSFHARCSGRQCRPFYTKDSAIVLEILKRFAPDFPVSLASPSTPTFGFGISIDRTQRCPTVLVVPTGSNAISSHPFTDQEPANHQLGHALNDCKPLISATYQLFQALNAHTIFFRQASASGRVYLPPGSSDSVVLSLDPTCPPPVATAPERVPAELQAAKHGIVYIALPGEGNVGTLVNGAGLAMNTCDVITARGGSPANFLDTGGKATGRTVVEGLRAVLVDQRVKVVFVNIFGGLTDCAMIADGILTAHKELEMHHRGVPLVVRLRGTNEEVGQQIIRDSGLPIHAFGDLDHAVEKVVELTGARCGQRDLHSLTKRARK